MTAPQPARVTPAEISALLDHARRLPRRRLPWPSRSPTTPARPPCWTGSPPTWAPPRPPRPPPRPAPTWTGCASRAAASLTGTEAGQ